MKILYLSPSVLPSRSANSIHVMRMCEAFTTLGCQVTLYAHRTVPEQHDDLLQILERYYGVKLPGVCLRTPQALGSLALNLRLGGRILFDILTRGGYMSCDLVVSRNLYASFFLMSILGKRLIYETHQLEYGLRKHLQAALLRSERITTVVISDAHRRLLTEYHGLQSFQPLVLHDAAADGIIRLSPEGKCVARTELAPDVEWEKYRAAAGYFGHLYPGRGIEVIEALVVRHPEIVFLLFGGNDAQIEQLQRRVRIPNLKIRGYLPPSVTARAMGMMDILLMPYQRKVSIGVDRHDTARWMSPLKMFEYMASGVPIISSRLPVLAEVLQDGVNCLMAEPESVSEWSFCLRRLTDDAELAERIASRAHQDYCTQYTWKVRAHRILEAVSR